MTDFWFKTFSILDFNVTISSYGIVKIKFMVSIVTLSHFSFALGIKSLLSSLITNPAEMRLVLTKWAVDLVGSKVRKAAMLSSV